MLSHRMSTPPTSQASRAYGPGNTPRISGMVANTPAPTIWVMLTAVARQRPRPRSSVGAGGMLGSGHGERRRVTVLSTLQKRRKAAAIQVLRPRLNRRLPVRHVYCSLTPGVVHHRARQALSGCLDWKPFGRSVAVAHLLDLLLLMAATTASLFAVARRFFRFRHDTARQ